MAKTSLRMGNRADVVADFPRGLPDSDKTSRSERSGGCDKLGEWKPGRGMIWQDASGAMSAMNDRHIQTVTGSRAGKGGRMWRRWRRGILGQSFCLQNTSGYTKDMLHQGYTEDMVITETLKKEERHKEKASKENNESRSKPESGNKTTGQNDPKGGWPSQSRPRSEGRKLQS